MKFKTIELFGIPGSGKTHIKNIIKNKILNKNYKIYSIRELIVNYAAEIIKINLLEKISLLYYKNQLKIKNLNYKKNQLINRKTNNIKKINNLNINFYFLTNIFFKDYMKICEKIYLKYSNENKKLTNLINQLISKSDIKYKTLFQRWFYEVCAARYVYEKVSYKKKIILLDDEAFIQRLFTVIYSNIKNKKKFIKEYIKLVPKKILIVHITRKKNRIHKTHLKRSFFNNEWKLNNNEIKKFTNLEKKIVLNLKKRKSFTIKNNSQLDNQIKKLIN